jgi:phage-related protein
LEDYFSWFDPAGWLSDIGNLISEGLGVLATPINALADGFNNFISGVGDFFTNLIDSLGSWFEDIGNFFSNLIDSLGSWFDDIGQWFADLGNDIGSWFQGVSDKITQFAENFSDAMSNFMSYLDPTSENFFLKLAFIPSDGFISGKFNELKVVIDDRLPIIGTLTELFNTITDVQSIESTKPKFEIELPDKWGGQTVEVINFDVIDPYIPYIKTLIRIFLWIPFLIKMYKRLPQVVY